MTLEHKILPSQIREYNHVDYETKHQETHFTFQPYEEYQCYIMQVLNINVPFCKTNI